MSISLFPLSLRSFVKVSLTKNPKKRPAAERMLFHPYVLSGDLTVRLSLDLLDKVRNPPVPGSSGAMATVLGGAPAGPGADDAEEEEAAASAPRRISSRAPRSRQKTQSELNSECTEEVFRTKNSLHCLFDFAVENMNFEVPLATGLTRVEPHPEAPRFNGGWQQDDDNPEVIQRKQR